MVSIFWLDSTDKWLLFDFSDHVACLYNIIYNIKHIKVQTLSAAVYYSMYHFVCQFLECTLISSEYHSSQMYFIKIYLRLHWQTNCCVVTFPSCTSTQDDLVTRTRGLWLVDISTVVSGERRQVYTSRVETMATGGVEFDDGIRHIIDEITYTICLHRFCEACLSKIVIVHSSYIFNSVVRYYDLNRDWSHLQMG